MNTRQFTVAILKMANIPTVTAKVRVTGREQSNSVNAYELQRSSAFTYIEKENKLERVRGAQEEINSESWRESSYDN